MDWFPLKTKPLTTSIHTVLKYSHTARESVKWYDHLGNSPTVPYSVNHIFI